jgi:hypothetical protein
MPSIADVVGDGLRLADSGAGDFCFWDEALILVGSDGDLAATGSR